MSLMVGNGGHEEKRERAAAFHPAPDTSVRWPGLDEHAAAVARSVAGELANRLAQPGDDANPEPGGNAEEVVEQRAAAEDAGRGGRREQDRSGANDVDDEDAEIAVAAQVGDVGAEVEEADREEREHEGDAHQQRVLQAPVEAPGGFQDQGRLQLFVAFTGDRASRPGLVCHRLTAKDRARAGSPAPYRVITNASPIATARKPAAAVIRRSFDFSTARNEWRLPGLAYVNATPAS